MTVSKISPEDFVRAWQAADNVQAVRDATNLSYVAVTKRASDYRKLGINLKKMAHQKKTIDVNALNKICEVTENEENL